MVACRPKPWLFAVVTTVLTASGWWTDLEIGHVASARKMYQTHLLGLEHMQETVHSFGSMIAYLPKAMGLSCQSRNDSRSKTTLLDQGQVFENLIRLSTAFLNAFWIDSSYVGHYTHCLHSSMKSFSRAPQTAVFNDKVWSLLLPGLSKDWFSLFSHVNALPGRIFEHMCDWRNCNSWSRSLWLQKVKHSEHRVKAHCSCNVSCKLKLCGILNDNQDDISNIWLRYSLTLSWCAFSVLLQVLSWYG